MKKTYEGYTILIDGKLSHSMTPQPKSFIEICLSDLKRFDPESEYEVVPVTLTVEVPD